MPLQDELDAFQNHPPADTAREDHAPSVEGPSEKQPRSGALGVIAGSATSEPRKKPTKAAVYAWIYPDLQRIAREHGYALGLHGSMNRDLDLIACPWTDEAAPAETLVAEMMKAVDGEFAPWDKDAGRNPCIKPHGRRAWSIYFSGHMFYIDLSIMPRSEQNIPSEPRDQ